MNIYLCIPTLIRYDLLFTTLQSAEAGEVKPTHYIILDNGNLLSFAEHIPKDCENKIYLYRASENLGVARSWNFFINLLDKFEPGYTIICNDDVKFFSDTLKLLIESYDENYVSYPGGTPSSNSFSCFLLPEKVVKTIGYFDESLSPNYAYFEDNDYHHRMKKNNFDLKSVDNCRLGHVGSATFRAMTDEQVEEHHIKFRFAQANYIKKWGGTPGNEKFTNPYNEIA
jgi:GT2 family glycosyltransferase